MAAIQLIGKEAVLSRFSKFDADTWALLQGKQFIASGSGSDELKDWLVDFEETGSTAAFTLRVYEGEAPTSNQIGRDFIGSINFKLIDTYEGAGIAGHSNKLSQRIEGLEKKLDALMEDDDDEEDLNSVIMGWLSEPEKLGQVVGAIKQLLGSAPIQSIAVVEPTGGQAISGAGSNPEPLTEAQLIRLSKALDILGKHDHKIVDHLDKLAALAQDSPLIFQGILAKLEAL